MNGARLPVRPPLELLDARPTVNVAEAEYRRLLGYPQHHAPGERADELAEWARGWFAANGRPWVYMREAELQFTPDSLRIEGEEFNSPQLLAHLRHGGATRAMLVAVSAGRACEEHARLLWQESKPDEYFFLEIFGSAVVEHLVASLSGRICDLAEHEGLMAVSHYSPGYAGWDVADQTRLFELVTRGMSQTFPETLEVLSSGMVRPKKSLLAVVGLTARTGVVTPSLVPCTACAFTPCHYRRAAYRNAPVQPGAVTTLAKRPSAPALTADARYTTNVRALRKWSQERVRLDARADGTIAACFHFDGTTCSNQGRPLAFDYTVTLSGPNTGYLIMDADCRPAPGDDGHTSMCAYLSDRDALMQAIATEKPLLGRRLNEVLSWNRTAAPSGCHCTAESRLHKWGLALEAIHFALAHRT